MRERTVGHSGLTIGEIGLGTLTWGRDTDEAQAIGQLRTLIDEGGNLLDTSPAFGAGASEALIGSLLAGTFTREDIVLCTKAGFTAAGSRSRFGAGRGSIFDSVTASLERMNTSYIDILMVAAPDPLAPDEETAEALASLVNAGTIRYIGLMGYPAWRAAAVQQLLKERHLPVLTAIQTEYSLLARDCEEEIIPMASHMGMGVLAASPLGRGVLTGKYRRTIPPTSRAASEHLAAFVDPYLLPHHRRIVEAVSTAADGLGTSPAGIALSWLLAQPGISSAITGARTVHQLRHVLDEIIELPDAIDAVLAEVTA
ncbi:aldo/keto reductase [Ancrocorticia sp.]|uniref:aldo/keto reductase n=1 Tax=Ancrocorticia sp. TaxID=2593684 RepID=UPI003F912DB5